jgi:hypothetical protein
MVDPHRTNPLLHFSKKLKKICNSHGTSQHIPSPSIPWAPGRNTDFMFITWYQRQDIYTHTILGAKSGIHREFENSYPYSGLNIIIGNTFVGYK